MPAQTSILEETRNAFRGTWALLRGDRRAPQNFDLTLRGLAGSFIAIIAVGVLLPVLIPLALGASPAPGSISRDTLTAMALLMAQVGMAAFVLRQIGRSDGFVPFLVVDNWTNAIAGLFVLMFGVLGIMAGLLVVGIAGLVLMVNNARLILTLTGWQIALLILSRFIAVGGGFMLIMALFGPPPELAAAAAAAASAAAQ